MRFQKRWLILSGAFGLAALSGCKDGLTRPDRQAEPVTATLRSERNGRGRQVMLTQLLEQAHTALAARRLTRPEFDNAYDKFRAMQLLDPGNVEARAGLDAVLLTLVALARDELARGHLGNAQAHYDAALARFPGAALTGELARELTSARRNQAKAQADLQQQLAQDSKVVLIADDRLRSETEEVKAWYHDLAARIQQEDASILIFARSDAEGRKIYRLIKSGTTGYLLRGDIRIDPTPRVQLLEPLP